MAKVLTGISGNLISAASAGFAPTNSADVSAIASAYQVVSATATQLYAGTAYVTSVNDAPLSASRAGNAANASLANSAWYDGTGRLISSLPDSAAVSAIASAYAESAASGKQDELEFSYDDDKISAINGSALAGQGGGAVTSVQSALNPWFGTSISGLNGSSLYSRWAESANSAGQASIANQATSASYAASAPTAWASSFITGVTSPSGTIRVLDGTAIEGTNSAMLPSKVLPGFESASSINADSWSPGTSIGPGVSVTGTIPYINPYTNLVLRMGWGEVTVSISGDNGETASVSKVGSDEYVTAQLPNAASYSLTTNGWVTLYAITASAITQEVGGGVGELAWASALPTYSYDAEDKISAINGSAIAGGAGGVDSATVSAIASSYAESAVSSKADASALSGYYTTANESGFITGVDLTDYATTAYVDSAVSSKADSSALSSYALSADVSGTVDLVSTQSANWGGSALALSAGPGVKFEKSGNTLVASTDETVLFSGSSYGVSFTETLSENITNFEYLGISVSNAKNRASYTVYPVSEYPTNNMAVPTLFNKDASYAKGIGLHGMTIVFNKTSADSITCGCWLFNFNDTVGNSDSVYLTKIVGINRTAEA